MVAAEVGDGLLDRRAHNQGRNTTHGHTNAYHPDRYDGRKDPLRHSSSMALGRLRLRIAAPYLCSLSQPKARADLSITGA